MWKALTIATIVIAGCSSHNGQNQVSGCDLRNELANIRRSPDSVAVALVACPEKTQITRKGPLNVEVALANVSDSVVAIRPSFVFGAWLNADIVAPDGGILEPVAHIEPPVPLEIHLSPGEMVDTTVDLLCAHGGKDMPGGCVNPYVFDQTGKYRITMQYTYRCADGPCASQTSKRITILAEPFNVILK